MKSFKIVIIIKQECQMGYFNNIYVCVAQYLTICMFNVNSVYRVIVWQSKK